MAVTFLSTRGRQQAYNKKLKSLFFFPPPSITTVFIEQHTVIDSSGITK